MFSRYGAGLQSKKNNKKTTKKTTKNKQKNKKQQLQQQQKNNKQTKKQQQKTKKTKLIALQCFTETWRKLPADVLRERLVMRLVNSKVGQQFV